MLDSISEIIHGHWTTATGVDHVAKRHDNGTADGLSDSTSAKFTVLTVLKGLYRAGADSARQQRLWWAIYHGDRFTSLLLGLPYGFNDVYYTDTLESAPSTPSPPEHQLILRCAIIAGKIIDRNIAPAKPSFAKTMDLYHQMDTIVTLMPEDWWEIPDEPPAPVMELNHLVERLLQQFFFFNVKLYLHLPFIVKKSPANSAYTISTLACIDASRQMLRIFLILHTKVDGAYLFDCKTSDFISFTAAVVLLLGTAHMNDSPIQNNHDDGDRKLIESAWRIFRTDAEEKGCKIASQCQKTLGILAGLDSSDRASLDQPHEIRIPYFGTVVRKPVNKQTNMLSHIKDISNEWRDSHTSPPLTTSLPNSSTGNIGENIWLDAYDFEYVGHDFAWGVVDVNNLLAGNPGSMVDLSMMDIDQDWGIFPDV